jgi:SAM-dependent methyltransferase
MALADILQYPQIYQGFQSIGQFFGARIRAIDAFLNIRLGDHVIDIGCGPGSIVKHLPTDIRYDGFDIEKRYIEYARRRFHARGSFHCRQFDLSCAAFLGSADVVMMNGLLHHLDNTDALALLRVAPRTLKPTGVLFYPRRLLQGWAVVGSGLASATRSRSLCPHRRSVPPTAQGAFRDGQDLHSGRPVSNPLFVRYWAGPPNLNHRNKR